MHDTDKINSIILETSSICNLRCTMCPTLSYSGSRGIMRDEVYERIFEQVKSIMPECINYSGWGEPFTDRKIFDRVSQASRLGIRTSLISNFTLINGEDDIRRLIDSGLSDINISFDGGTKSVYESIRINADFEHTFHNIVLLSRLNQASSHKIDLFLSFVAMKQNIADLQCLLDKLNQNGVELRGFFVKPLDVVSHKNNFDSIISKRTIDKYLKRIKTDYNLIAVNISGNNKIQGDCLARARNSIFINYEGMVSPCCNLGHPVPRLKSKYLFKIPMSRYFVGDLKTEEITTIWNGKESVEFRNKLRSSQTPPQCKYCNLI